MVALVVLLKTYRDEELILQILRNQHLKPGFTSVSAALQLPDKLMMGFRDGIPRWNSLPCHLVFWGFLWECLNNAAGHWAGLCHGHVLG